MPATSVKITGMKELIQKLDPAKMDRQISTIMTGAAEIVRKPLQTYPTTKPTPGVASANWTEKQRRWFWWALKSGLIQVPYARTGTLGKSWTREIRRVINGWVAIVGNRIGYAQLVQDEGKQAAIHRGRWPTAQQVVKDKGTEVVRFIESALRRAIKL